MKKLEVFYKRIQHGLKFVNQKLMSLSYLLEGIQSPNREERENAESSLLEHCANNPPQTFIELIDIASEKHNAVNIRQLSLLCLRKLITMHWSAGFPSFIGPPGVGEEGKDIIRSSLLNLLANANNETKITSTVTYCIVQICAVDFPDEWPGLLDYLNDIILNQHSENAIVLLTELVEDVITNEMFFDNAVGRKILDTVLLSLKDQNMQAQTKSKILKLYQFCLSQLDNISIFLSPEQINEWLQQHLQEVNKCISNLLLQYESNDSLEAIELQGELFNTLNKMFGVNQKVLGSKGDFSFGLRMVLAAIECNSDYFVKALTQPNEARIDILNTNCVYAIQYLASIPEELFTAINYRGLTESLIKLCLLSEDHFEICDFNDYVASETGLTSAYTARNEIGQFVSTCDELTFSAISKFALERCLQWTSNDARIQESSLYLFQELCSNEISMNISRYQDFLSLAVMIMDDSSCPTLVKSRAILATPRFIENNTDNIPAVKEVVQQLLIKTVNCTSSSDDDILLSSFVICFTYYSSFAELQTVLDKQTSLILQDSLLIAIESLYQSCEEDSLGLLLEAMHDIVKCWNMYQTLETRERILNLLLRISSSEPSNVRIVLEAVRSIPHLLKDLKSADYTRLCQNCFPSFVDTLSTFLQSHQTYSPMVTLTLEFLSAFVRNPPVERAIPDVVVNYVLAPLVQFIKQCPDENIIVTALHALALLACNSDERYWKDSINEICSLAFNNERSLYRIIDVTPIMLLSIRIDKSQQNKFIKPIMEQTIEKLSDHNKVHPVDSFVIILCEILCIDLRGSLDFLFSPEVNMHESIGQYCIFELLKSFEETRSKNMLKELSITLSMIYFENDQRVIELSFQDDSNEERKSFKSYLLKMFSDELILQLQLEESQEEEEDADEDYEDDYMAQENDDLVLLTGRDMSMTLIDVLTAFFKKLHETNDECLKSMLNSLTKEEVSYISKVLS